MRRKTRRRNGCWGARPLPWCDGCRRFPGIRRRQGRCRVVGTSACRAEDPVQFPAAELCLRFDGDLGSSVHATPMGSCSRMAERTFTTCGECVRVAVRIVVNQGGGCAMLSVSMVSLFSVQGGHGYIAQWSERLTADQQVPGSNPGTPSHEFFLADFLSLPVVGRYGWGGARRKWTVRIAGAMGPPPHLLACGAGGAFGAGEPKGGRTTR